jgi:mRNA-degrading endonuclease RelE of RelBE toxin-antitoxin system
MDRITKFYKKLNKVEREKIRTILLKLLKNEISELKFKKLKGYDDVYTLRSGKIRIICKKEDEKYFPIDVDFRKNVYKKFK